MTGINGSISRATPSQVCVLSLREMEELLLQPLAELGSPTEFDESGQGICAYSRSLIPPSAIRTMPPPC